MGEPKDRGRKQRCWDHTPCLHNGQRQWKRHILAHGSLSHWSCRSSQPHLGELSILHVWDGWLFSLWSSPSLLSSWVYLCGNFLLSRLRNTEPYIQLNCRKLPWALRGGRSMTPNKQQINISFLSELILTSHPLSISTNNCWCKCFALCEQQNIGGVNSQAFFSMENCSQEQKWGVCLLLRPISQAFQSTNYHLGIVPVATICKIWFPQFTTLEEGQIKICLKLCIAWVSQKQQQGWDTILNLLDGHQLIFLKKIIQTHLNLYFCLPRVTAGIRLNSTLSGTLHQSDSQTLDVRSNDLSVEDTFPRLPSPQQSVPAPGKWIPSIVGPAKNNSCVGQSVAVRKIAPFIFRLCN